MTDDRAAVAAVFTTVKHLKTRDIVELIFEVPANKATEIIATLGGVPMAGESRWCGIAWMKEQPEEPKEKEKAPRLPRPWHQLSIGEQAGIRCTEASFREFLESIATPEWRPIADEKTAAEFLRMKFGVESRRDIDPARWDALMSRYRAYVAVGAA